MKKNTMVKIIKNVKIFFVLLAAELLKLYYINKIDDLTEKITNRINRKHLEVTVEELDKLFPDEDDEEVRV